MSKNATQDAVGQSAACSRRGGSPTAEGVSERGKQGVFNAQGTELSSSFRMSESFLPVSSVAREWGISSRRVRVMLTEGRLRGRQGVNGYWEVAYPYTITSGTRGPAPKRFQTLAARRREIRARFKEQTT